MIVELLLVNVKVDSTGTSVTVDETSVVSNVVRGTVRVWVVVEDGDVELGVCPDVFVGTKVDTVALGILVAKGWDAGLPPVSRVV